MSLQNIEHISVSKNQSNSFVIEETGHPEVILESPGIVEKLANTVDAIFSTVCKTFFAITGVGISLICIDKYMPGSCVDSRSITTVRTLTQTSAIIAGIGLTISALAHNISEKKETERIVRFSQAYQKEAENENGFTIVRVRFPQNS